MLMDIGKEGQIARLDGRRGVLLVVLPGQAPPVVEWADARAALDESPDDEPQRGRGAALSRGCSRLLRRLARILPTHQGEVVAWRGLRLDIQGHFLLWDNRQVALTPKQVMLMQAFLRAPATLLSRAQLMQDVWGTNFMGDTRTLEVHIHGMRKLLKRLQTPFVLETERGKGYRLICRLPESVPS